MLHVWVLVVVVVACCYAQVVVAQGTVTGFSLIDTSTNIRQVIRSLTNGDTIDLAEVGSSLSLRAETKGAVGSVLFDLNEEPSPFRIENQAEYALGGNRDDTWFAVNQLAVVRTHTVSATPYSNAGASGASGATLTYTLNVIDSSGKDRNRDHVDDRNTTRDRVDDADERGNGKDRNRDRNNDRDKNRERNDDQGDRNDDGPGNGKDRNRDRNSDTGRNRDELPQGPVSPSPTKAPVARAPIPSSPTKATAPVVASSTDVQAYDASRTGALSGEMRKWHKITLGFEGPNTSETDTPNPFTDYRLDVTFTQGSTEYVVPGYYGADGNAANSGASSGNVWLVHFSPDKTGTWSWEASFVTGSNVAMNGGGSSAGYFDGATGSFNIRGTNKRLRDHRGKGRLQYVGQHHLQFAETKEWFLKAGADAPENFLAYDDFDNTPNNGRRRKSWSAHADDYKGGDPTWAGGKGKAIIGAINYLADKDMNAFSFIPMNIEGDDQNVFPYISDSPGDDRLRIDVSKTAQWEVVFEHADHIGMFMHFKTQEQENDQLLDGGDLGDERKLYYRELIARFSHHLALNWNIGEENTNTDQQRKDFADFLKRVDPYKHPVVIHTGLYAQSRVYPQLLGYPSYDGVSIQKNAHDVFSETLKWRIESAAAGHKWVVANDEQQGGVLPDSDDPNHDIMRMNALWGNLMAGGAGVEYYTNRELALQDFRSRANMWDQSRHALLFFRDNRVPFWDMMNDNSRVSNGNWCLSQLNNNTIVVYLKNGGTTSISLSGDVEDEDVYTVKWFDPRNGGSLEDGSILSLGIGDNQDLGSPPSSVNEDWVVLLKRQRQQQSSAPTVLVPPTSTPSQDPTNNAIAPTSQPASEPSPQSSPTPLLISSKFRPVPSSPPSPVPPEEEPGRSRELSETASATNQQEASSTAILGLSAVISVAAATVAAFMF